jgi:hypothetical protein
MTPTIITRAQWGAQETGLEVYTTTWDRRTGFITHYSAGPPDQRVRAIQDYHLSKGWGDIGYNFLVDRAGRVYLGRLHSWAAIGAHARDNNTANIGVCFIGGNADVTAAGKASILWLYQEANRLAGRSLAKRYHSLVNTGTECPGDNLRDWVIAGMPTPELEDDDMSLDEPLHKDAPGATVRTALTEVYLARGGRGQINATLVEFRRFAAETRAKLDALLAAASDDVRRDAEEKTRDAEQALRHLELLEEVRALDPSDSDALAELLGRIRVVVDAEDPDADEPAAP